MDNKKLIKILEDKVKARFPAAENFMASVEYKFDSYGQKFTVTVSAYYKNSYLLKDNPDYKASEFIYVTAKNLSEMISAIDQSLLGYKKTEKLTLD